MTPKYFWRCSPRKFNALCKVHARLNGAKDKPGAPTKGKKGKAPRKPIAKQPETYIDKIM